MAETKLDAAFAFSILGVEVSASVDDLKRAYRRESIKVHPDRNPDDPNAAIKFVALKEAFDFLSDPVKRTAAATELKAKAAREERFSHLGEKRKAFLADLEAREAAFTKQRTEQTQRKTEQELNIERIKEASRRLKEERGAAMREKEMKQREEAIRSQPSLAADSPEDTSVKLKWSRKLEIRTQAEVFIRLSEFGSLSKDDVIVVDKPGSKKITAVVQFQTIPAAFSCVQMSGRGSLSGMEASWLLGEPAAVNTLRKNGMLSQSGDAAKPSGEPVPHAAASSTAYEDITMMRLRERERLANEIR